MNLDDLFEIARGGSPRPIDAFITDDPTGMNWIMIGDASDGSKYISTTKKKIRKEGVAKSRIVKPGDFLLTNSMSFGRPYIVRTEGCIHDGWLVLTPRDSNVDPDFFYYLLGSKQTYLEFERLAAGATVKNLNIDLVKKVRVFLPPIDDQRRIAAILDRVEALRTKRRQALAKVDTLIQSIFLEMFGDPLSGPIKRQKFGDVIEDMRYGPRFYNESYSATGVRIVRITDLDDSGALDYSAMPRLQVSKEEEAAYVLREGDIIFARSGSVGRVALIPAAGPPAIAGAYFIQIKVRTNLLDPEFLVDCIRMPSVQELIIRRARQSSQPNFSGPAIRSLEIPIPPLSEQQTYVKRRNLADKLRKMHHVGLSQSAELSASLQSRAFRGDL